MKPNKAPYLVAKHGDHAVGQLAFCLEHDLVDTRLSDRRYRYSALTLMVNVTECLGEWRAVLADSGEVIATTSSRIATNEAAARWLRKVVV